MTKPHVTFELDNAGHAFVGMTEFDDNGDPTRTCVLTHGGESAHPRIIFRRYQDMVRLMGDNVTSEILAPWQMATNPYAPYGCPTCTTRFTWAGLKSHKCENG